MATGKPNGAERDASQFHWPVHGLLSPLTRENDGGRVRRRRAQRRDTRRASSQAGRSPPLGRHADDAVDRATSGQELEDMMFRENRHGEAIPANLRPVRVVRKRSRKKLHSHALATIQQQLLRQARRAASVVARKAASVSARKAVEKNQRAEQARINIERAQQANAEADRWSMYGWNPRGMVAKDSGLLVPWLLIDDARNEFRHFQDGLPAIGPLKRLRYRTRDGQAGVAVGDRAGLRIKTDAGHRETIPWAMIEAFNKLSRQFISPEVTGDHSSKDQPGDKWFCRVKVTTDE